MDDLREKIARAMWDEREKSFPSFAQRQPTAYDEATGAWQAMLQQAAAALRAIEEAGFVIVPKEPDIDEVFAKLKKLSAPLNLEEPRG